uniref:Uncharacterized protein n=1 Tax=Chromera velia CCMP2878 TaxID=1169474 RepID=A0A0G4F3M3_9ALVE|eukprot:Cvel_14838.t1-p1 / transcript=Cvel_14838.t1 / gene=Cvel_14838 / organism=Chromera_velia_CCMP2878 / gene_product=hypothetical protein / transcript_product=hypothetical protein / location=Cvel_scaffold1071:47623-49099(+) / protein_length=305 / sequence_SO=supercontig / SO=protein_coding / is_pseudo=false
MDLTRQELVDVLTVLATVFSFWTPTALRVQNVEKISELLLNMGRSKDFPVPGLDYDETLLEEKEEKKKKKCGKVENIMAAAIIKVLTRAFSVVYLLVPGFGTFAGKFLERLGDGPVVLDFFMLRQLRKQLMEKVQGSKDQMKQAKQEAKTKAKEKFKEFTNDAGQKWPQYLRTVLAWNNILSIALTASFPRAVTVYIAVGLTSINEIINHILSSEFLNYDRAVSIGIDKFSRAKKEIGTTLTEDLEGVTEAVGVPNTQVIQVRSRAEDENPLAGALNADSGGAVPSAAGLAEENLAENLPGVPSE